MADDVIKNLGVQHDGADNKAYATAANVGVMHRLINKSGGSVVTGDVLVADTGTDLAFTTTTTEALKRTVYVVPYNVTGDDVQASKTIAADEYGWVYKPGAVCLAAIDGAVSRGEYLVTSSTAKKLHGTDKIEGTDKPPAGTCALALQAATEAGNILVRLIDTVQVSDAADMTYTPAVLSDWDGDADPGNVDDALDQLAERVDDVELGGSVPVQYVSTTEVGPSNTTDETTLVSCSVPAGLLGSNRLIELEADVKFNNGGGAGNMTFKVKYGATTLITHAWSCPAGTANARGTVKIRLWNLGVSSQAATLQHGGSEDTNAWLGHQAAGTAAENSSGALTFALTMTLYLASATVWYKVQNVRIIGPLVPTV